LREILIIYERKSLSLRAKRGNPVEITLTEGKFFIIFNENPLLITGNKEIVL
jgi:hypothetical protein